jgi:hypothetical protein
MLRKGEQRRGNATDIPSSHDDHHNLWPRGWRTLDFSFGQPVLIARGGSDFSVCIEVHEGNVEADDDVWPDRWKEQGH